MTGLVTRRKEFCATRTSLSAIAAVLLCSAPGTAEAQQSLPTIEVGKIKRVAQANGPRAAGPVRTEPAAVGTPQPVAGAGGGGASGPAPFIPAGTQVLRGPTDVHGYFAGGTSTATKTNTPILDIPQSITILTKQQLEDRNSLTLNQALTYVPGVTVAQGEGQRDQITIRGQPTTADFYTDNVRDDAEYYRDLYNIQAVEVLKGPSALIFGRGGGGGVVNRVTKKADGVTRRDIQVSTGSFGRKRVTFDVGQAINDQLAFRVNGLYEQSYNYRNFFDMERWGINPTFTWKPFEKTLVTLSYEHYYDHRVVDRGVPSVNFFRAPSVLAAQSLGLGYLFPGYPAPTPRWTFFGNPEVNYAKTDVDRAVVSVDHTTDFGLNIKNQTVYANYAKFYQNTYANSAVNFTNAACSGAIAPCDQLSGYNSNNPRQNIFSQTDLTYTWQMAPEVKHVFLAGMEAGNQLSGNNRNIARWNNPFTGSANINTFFGLPTVYTPVVFNNALAGFRRHTNLDVFAGYVQDQISITKYVDILAGVRYDNFNIKFVNNLAVPNPTLTNYWGQTISSNTSRWSPRVGLVVKPFEQLSLYASYSRSFLPTGGDQFTTLTVSDANLQPQGFENAEAGFKAEITPTLLFTGAIYNLNRSNQPIAINALYNVLTNTRTTGGELGLVGYLTKEWEVSLGYGNQHAYVVSSDRNIAFAGTGSGVFFTEKGKNVPSVPQNTFSFWNKYDVSSLIGLAPGVFGLGSGVIYNSKFYAALDNAVIVPGYARWDGAAYLKISENVSGQVNVENILGAMYYASAHNNNNIMPGAPRSAYVTINAKF
jgi:catecholate siderophore receptor